MDFAVAADHKVKIQESKKNIGKYLDLVRELKVTVGDVGDGDTSCTSCTWNGLKNIGRKTGGIGNWTKKWNHQNYSVIEIDQNSEKSPVDLRRLTVTLTPVKDNQLTLV